MSRLWDKGEPLDELVLRYTAGEDHALDDRLVPHDVRASIAHGEMLAAQGLLGAADLAAIRAGLEALAAEHAAGAWRITLAEEDVHTALEARLVERIGAAAERLHLGRSRNDQVLAALRLYLRQAIGELQEAAGGVAAALAALAGRDGEVAIPGYTHQRRAMPTTAGDWARGFAAELADDVEGLQAARRRVEKNPLGSAAGYGVPLLPLDRLATTRALGFAVTQEPVTAVQLSRGKAEAQVLFEIALLLRDLGRLATDLVLWSGDELALVELPVELTTGSSIMPQKRNPDVFELVRGRSATAQALLDEALAIQTRLGSGYHRDLQLLKAPLFRGIDLGLATCAVMSRAVAGVRFRRDRGPLPEELFAAEQAYRLVLDEGLPFREAYRRVAARLGK